MNLSNQIYFEDQYMKRLIVFYYAFFSLTSFVVVKAFQPLDYDVIAKNYANFEEVLTQEGITKDKIEKIFFTTLSDDIIGIVVNGKVGTYKLYVKKRKKLKYVSRIEYHECIGSR